MADNGTRTNFICSYFEKGLAGNNSETIKSNTTCRFFKIGTCKYGSACYFRHDSEPANNACIQNNLQDSSSINQRTVPTATSMELKNTTRSIHVPEEWVKAPEFIPSTISSVAGSSTSNNEMFNASGTSTGASKPLLYAQVESPSGQAFDHTLQSLCPYAENTETYETNCPYLHGNICELYGHAALHPCNEVFQKRHTNACIKQHEVDMELSFDIQRSKEMSCGICFEIIMEKSSSDQRFGILPNCNHCYCLTCIKKWRRTKDFERKIRKACPECRVISDFIYPSMYWVDAKEEKEKLIKDYKNALSTQDCKYFRKGLGICPRGNKCLMLHALPDGSKIDFSSPRNSNNEVLHFYSNLFNNGFSFV